MMNRYLLKRIFLFFPAFVSVLTLTMILGHLAGEIPPEYYRDDSRRAKSQSEIEEYKEEKGLNEPFFYFGIQSSELLILSAEVYFPRFTWNGSNNRFNRYMRSIVNGSFGFSEYHQKPVSELIIAPFLRTLMINIIVVLISYGLGLYLGYFQTINNKAFLSRVLDALSQFFYAIPSFWLAILLIWTFANQYMFRVFPMQGWSWEPELGFFQAIISLSYHLILPVFCLSIGSVAYIAAIFHSRIQSEMQKGYFLSAIAKGLSKRATIRKHVLKNAILPIVAISSGLLPSLISGSVIIESIFGIPGMGKLAFDSFLARDYPTIYAITLFAVVLTWINWILVDYTYSRIDPRIEFG